MLLRVAAAALALPSLPCAQLVSHDIAVAHPAQLPGSIAPISRVTDDEGAGNRVCTAALNALCRGTEPNSCSVCCGRHQHELRAASCSAADCEAYCAPGGGAATAISRPLDGSHFLGYNVVNMQSGNFSTDRAYVSGTAALRPGTLRYPGGNLGDWWDWRTGWCVTNTSVPSSPQVTNPCYAPHAKPVRRYPLEEFTLALAASGARPVLMVNLWTGDLSDQLAFLAHARAIGALPPHSYVELGGEFYWGKFSGRWATGGEYGETAVQWATAIKARFQLSPQRF